MADTIESLRRKLEAATPGEWKTERAHMGRDGREAVWLTRGDRTEYMDAADATLIVAAHAALPALLAVAEAAEKVRCGHCGSDSFAKSCTRCGDLRRALASLTRNDEVERG